jgi:hypothetical protein
MKKIIIILLFLSFSCFAKEYHCQVLLNGESTYPDNLIIPDVTDKDDCLVKAKELFKKNSKTYTDLFVFSDEKWVRVKTSEK